MRIGLFDSGIGGLTVMAACKRLLPRASYLYMDAAPDAPYGEKSDEEIIAAARGCLHTLMNAGCDAVVIACNTATAVAAGALRSEYPDFRTWSARTVARPHCTRLRGARSPHIRVTAR